MNRTETINAVAKKAGVGADTVASILDAFQEVATKALKKGDDVNLTGFGKFHVIERQARNGVNPQTLVPMKLPACKVVKFSMGTQLKEVLG